MNPFSASQLPGDREQDPLAPGVWGREAQSSLGTAISRSPGVLLSGTELLPVGNGQQVFLVFYPRSLAMQVPQRPGGPGGREGEVNFQVSFYLF